MGVYLYTGTPTPVDYIDNGGTGPSNRAALDTGLIIQDNYLKLQFGMVPKSFGYSGNYVYGRNQGSSSTSGGLTWLSLENYGYSTQSTGVMYFNAGTNTWVSGVPNITMQNDVYYVCDIKYNNGTITTDVNGTTGTGTYSGSIARTVGTYFWDNHFFFMTGSITSSGVSSSAARINLYYLKIYTGSNYTLVRDYIPAVENNVAGFYDRVNRQFYSSGTSTPFIYGSINS